MKAPRCAAVALVGWCLMLAPHHGRISKSFDYDAPLSKWQKGETYDSKAACESARKTQISERQDKYYEVSSRQTKKVLQNAIYRLRRGQCVSTEDPKLKDAQ